jgi:hypothetical protein
MTPYWQVYALLGGTFFLATVIGLFGMLRAASLADCDCEGRDSSDEALFAENYLVGWDGLRTAVLTGDRETTPGGPSADLIDCWGLWPDAPAFTHPGEDETS